MILSTPAETGERFRKYGFILLSNDSIVDQNHRN